MDKSSSYSDVDQIAGVETFRVEFENSPSSVTQTIYANTRNQVPVVISLKAYGSDGEVLNLVPDNVKNNLALHYKRASAEAGDPLSWRDTNGALSYDDRKNKFCVSAAQYGEMLESEQPITVRENNQTIYITYYISANQENSVGRDVVAVLKSSSLPNGSINTSGSTVPVSAVNIRALVPVTYKKEDIRWEKMPNQTPNKLTLYYFAWRQKVETQVYTHNYYLSCNKHGFRFIDFQRQGYASQPGQNGLAGWKISDDWRHLKCVFVHAYGDKKSMKFNYNYQTYNTPSPYTINTYVDEGDHYMCFTQIKHEIKGVGMNFKPFDSLPNGTMTKWWQYKSTEITVYDQYGNKGFFYPDTRNIDDDLNIYDYKING